MVRQISLILLVVVLGGAAAHSQTSKQTAPPAPKFSAIHISQSGAFDGNVYSNKDLGFTISIPKGWSLFSEDLNKAILTLGREKIRTNESEKFEAEMDKSVANTRILFQTTPFAFGKPGNTANLICGIEVLRMAGTIEAYLEFNKRLVLANPDTRLLKDLNPVTFAKTPFISFTTEGRTPGGTYKQLYIATMRKGVALFFVVTFTDDKYQKEVGESLQSLEFSK